MNFAFHELFSTATQPAISFPSPNEPGPSNAPNAQPGGRRTGSSQASSTASSPPSGNTSSRRRVRPKIALAPGQPPTARGNDRIRVYVACHECRSRKIRCDGAKPICVQCQKRPPTSGACSYDAAPNRKGHDRRGKGTSRSAPGPSAAKRRRTGAGLAPSDHADQSRSSSESDTEQPDTSLPASSDDPEDAEALEHIDTGAQEIFDFNIDDAWEYDPFPLDPDNPNLFELPQFPPISPPHSHHSQEDQQDESIPSRPSVQFSRETWWDALLAFYASERDITPDEMHAISLTSDQRNRSMRYIISDLRAVFQSSASWMSFLNLPRFFATVLDPLRRTEMQPSLLMSMLALGVLSQSSELERGLKGRQRALKLLDMAHGALQSSLAAGWVDVGLAQSGWMIMYFELNSHPMQSWQRSQSAMLLLDSLVRLFSLTTLDAGQHRKGMAGSSALESLRHSISGGPDIMMYPPTTSISEIAPQLPNNLWPPQAQPSLPQFNAHGQFIPQPTPQTLQQPQPIPNPFYSTSLDPIDPILPRAGRPSTMPPGATASSSGHRSSPPHTHTHTHTNQTERGCDCARLSLKANWPSVKEFAPTWSTTIMWPANLSEAEFRREECRRLVWSSVAMVANMNAYASITPQGIIETGVLFVREFEDFALQTPSETLALSGLPIQVDDVWSLNLRAMLLLHACLRVRASPTLSGAQRAEFAVRAWLEIDDIEKRLERHTCGLSSNYGFASVEMLFSLRLCVSYEFKRFIPQITTTGSAMFYRDKAESYLRYLNVAAKSVWDGIRTATPGDRELNHRKVLFIFWFMSGIKKCLVLWEADATLTLALTVACQSASYLEYFLMYWPATRLRQIWQGIRYQLVEACMKAGLPTPSAAIPRPIPRNDPASVAAGTAP
ncbi:uncharacterized protein TRAVEDRAFT_69195 [Trametes versicolor FP-101664 SS1]|uniref:uncharacterized protein n=1 Tax=Trametes versicolor (strain FP-101664) TaxID=717944 RepID=UPI0004623F54|nr:uncharacterized protein TRAVEDRAFT_69195 [Trametes versicolor FP-101664 SS1]EIW63043.1 hypothetical protein TRAVEDRAFT_69195 [Trametes versicolor FP-101664 SS1]